jgi:ligand-binding SRPBCC domain-containing protein
MIHLLKRSQIVSADLETCWRFFSNPANLARITPPDLDFQILSDLPHEIYEGLMIEYRVRPLFGIPLPWLTEITHVRRPSFFVDEQRVGPYAVWHHEHEFHAIDAQRTEILDRVHYVLPFAPLSEIIHPFLVQPRLEKIFSYRKHAIEEIFKG